MVPATEATTGLPLPLGHSASVHDLSLSPDGKLVATASADGLAIVWDLCSRTQLRALPHSRPVVAVAFAGEQRIVTATNDGTLALWRVTDGTLERSAHGAGLVKHLYATPDGRSLWASSWTHGVFELDPTTLAVKKTYVDDGGVAVSRFAARDGAYSVIRWKQDLAIYGRKQSHLFLERRKSDVVLSSRAVAFDKEIRSAAVIADGQTAVVGTADGFSYMVDAEGQVKAAYSGHAGPVEGVDIDAGGASFLSHTGTEHIVLIRSVATGAVLKKFDLKQGNAADARLISRDEVLIADINKDGIEFASLSGQETEKFKSIGSPVRAALVSGDKRRIVTTSDDYVHVWSVEEGVPDLQYRIHDNNRIVALDSSGTRLYTSKDLPFDYSDWLEVRALHTGELLDRFPHTSTVTAAAYSPDGKQLATGEFNGKIRVFNAETHALLHQLPGHPNTVSSLAFGPADTLLSVGGDYTGRVWSMRAEAELWREDVSERLGGVFSPSGRLMASWSGGVLRIFDVEHHALLDELPDMRHYAFLSDDRLLAAKDKDSTLNLWIRGVPGVSVVGEVSDPDVDRIYVVGESRALVCSGGTAVVYGLAPAAKLKTFEEADCSAGGVPFIIVRGGKDEEVWDVSQMRMVKRLRLKTSGYIRGFQLSPDHHFLMLQTGAFESQLLDLASGHSVRNVPFAYSATYSSRSSLPTFGVGNDRYLTSEDSEGTPRTEIEVRTGDGPPRHFASFPYALQSMELSADNASLLTCSTDSVLRLHDTRSGKLRHELEHACFEARFSPDGKFVVASENSGESRPRLWTANLDKEIPAPNYVPADVKYAAVSVNGSRLVTVEAEDALRLWDLRKGEELPFPGVRPTGARIRGAELLLGGGVAVIAYSDGDVRTLDLHTGTPFADSVAAGPIRSIHRAGVNDQVYATLHDDGSLRIWALGMTKARQTFPSPAGIVTAVALSDDARMVLRATAKGPVEVWDSDTGKTVEMIPSPCAATAVALNPQKSVASMICVDGVVRAYDLTHHTWLSERDSGQRTPVERLQVLGAYTAVISKENFVVMLPHGELMHPFTAPTPTAQGMLFIDEDNQVKALRAGTTVDITPASRQFSNPSAVFRESATGVSASPDGRTLAVGYSSGWLRFWDMQTGKMGRGKLVGGTRVTGLTYSSSGKHLLLIQDDKTAIDFNVSMNDVWIRYPSSADVVTANFAGRNDQLVAIAVGKQMRLFDSANGLPVLSSVLGSDGSSWVIEPDGRYQSHAAAQTSGSGGPVREPASAKWVETLNRPFAPRPGLAPADLVPPGRELQFGGTELAEDESKPGGPAIAAPTGSSLRSVIELIGSGLGFSDQLKVDAGSTIVTTQTGEMQIGSALLERALQGQSSASALGLVAFVLGHEHQHSLQSRTSTFAMLSDEEHRVLECEADVLGTQEAMKFVALLAGSPEGPEALAALRNAQARVALMSTIEGVDQAHPTQEQRSVAVEFGLARYLSQFDHDQLRAFHYERQYQTKAPGDDQWTESVCRRILHFHADDQGKLSVAKENEHSEGARWEADLRYKNSSGQSLHVSHHVRLVGAAYSVLSGVPRPGLANIDGVLNDFVLKAGEERVIKVSFTSIDPVGLRFEPSTIVFSNMTDQNWMSVEAVSAPAPDAPMAAPKDGPATPPASQGFCSEAASPDALTPRQRELGEFLFQASTDADTHFKSFRQGNALLPQFGLELGTSTKAVFQLSFSSSGSVADDTNGRSTLVVDLTDSRQPGTAQTAFTGIVDDLKALCPAFALKTSTKDGPTLKFSSATLEKFSRGVSISVTMVEPKANLPPSAALLVQQRGADEP